MIATEMIEKELRKASDMVEAALDTSMANKDVTPERRQYDHHLFEAKKHISNAIAVSEQHRLKAPARSGPTGSQSDSSMPDQAASDRTSADIPAAPEPSTPPTDATDD